MSITTVCHWNTHLFLQPHTQMHTLFCTGLEQMDKVVRIWPNEWCMTGTAGLSSFHSKYTTLVRGKVSKWDTSVNTKNVFHPNTQRKKVLLLISIRSACELMEPNDYASGCIYYFIKSINMILMLYTDIASFMFIILSIWTLSHIIHDGQPFKHSCKTCICCKY